MIKKVEMTKNDDGTAKATVTTTTTENGEVLTDVKIIEGLEEEVKTQLETLKGTTVIIEKISKE